MAERGARRSCRADRPGAAAVVRGARPALRASGRVCPARSTRRAEGPRRFQPDPSRATQRPRSARACAAAPGRGLRTREAQRSARTSGARGARAGTPRGERGRVPDRRPAAHIDATERRRAHGDDDRDRRDRGGPRTGRPARARRDAFRRTRRPSCAYRRPRAHPSRCDPGIALARGVIVPTSASAATTRRPGGSAAPPRTVIFGAISLLCAAAYAFAIVASGGDVMLLLPLAGAIVVLGICAYPTLGLFVLFASAILFEQVRLSGIEPPITETKFFVNINAYTPLPIRLSIPDLLMLVTGAALLARRRIEGERLRMGALGPAVLGYVGVFALGTIIGAARGGAWNADVALGELRAP